jgi:hypothetical protein
MVSWPTGSPCPPPTLFTTIDTGVDLTVTFTSTDS